MKLNHVLIGAGVGILCLIGIISSCKKKTDDPRAEYDRTSLLNVIGNKLIIPNYQDLSTAVNKLDSGIAVFVTTPTAATLSNVQDLHKDAYRAWQYCSFYEFGPGVDNSGAAKSIKKCINIYPADTSQIKANMAANYTLLNMDASINFPAQGFPAIDYLLFDTLDNNTSVLARYTTSGSATNRKNYLSFVSGLMKTRVTNVLNGWLPSGGNYIQTFVSNTGTDVGSSISVLLNQYINDYENIKNANLLIPAGIGDTITHKEKTEAYYSGISAELAKLQLKAAQDIYLGRTKAGVDSTGFDDVLIGLNAQGGTLDPHIKSQFNTAINTLGLLPDRLSNTILTNPAGVNSAYTELQKLLVLLKQQMPGELYILISFGDADGD
ncbi:MAG: hypothetical protein JWO58_2618 [Chitinophagaceae bacterium]|nr:hypothetical protein [Chitinophagaceae bacterium]